MLCQPSEGELVLIQKNSFWCAPQRNTEATQKMKRAIATQQISLATSGNGSSNGEEIGWVEEGGGAGGGGASKRERLEQARQYGRENYSLQWRKRV